MLTLHHTHTRTHTEGLFATGAIEQPLDGRGIPLCARWPSTKCKEAHKQFCHVVAQSFDGQGIPLCVRWPSAKMQSGHEMTSLFQLQPSVYKQPASWLSTGSCELGGVLENA
mmetsp:Transcript_24082/g.65922  ORF Transcript_24082/g.65922 Transcript_24082/m.65922 type:complete len:112 (+) Transcript_24082:1127-1462(+)